MGFINQLFYATKRVMVDGKALVIKLFSFLFMIGLLGVVFNGSFQVSSIDDIQVVYYSEDSGEAGKQFLDTFLEVDSIKELATFKEVMSFEEGSAAVNNEEAGAFIYIPKDFTDEYMDEDKKAGVEVYCQKYSGLNKTIIQCIMDSYINAMNTVYVVMDMEGQLIEYNLELDSNIKNVPISKDRQMSSFQYYAISMLLLLMLYGAEYGCWGMSEDVIGVLGEKIRISPLEGFDQYIGKLLGFSIATFIQALIVVGVTIVAFGVSWGSHPFLLVFIIFTFSVVGNMIGMTLITLFRDMRKAGPLVFVMAFVCTFIAGGFIATDFGAVGHLSPSYYAKTAIFNLLYEGSPSITYTNIAVLWGIIIALSTISIVVARRKRS